jgi:hypothetical protein
VTSIDVPVKRRAIQRVHPYVFLGVLLVVLLICRPVSPDLIAQLARATASKTTENASWWTSWYGGIATRSYSTITPFIMGLFGTWTVGAISVLITTLSATAIMKQLHRYSRSAILGFGIGTIADLASGRVTFAFGAALGSVALLLFLKKKMIMAIAFAIAATLASALAGFFLGLIVLPLCIDRTSRNRSLVLGGVLAVTVTATSIAFPTHGYDPMLWNDILLSVVAGAFLWVATENRYARQLAVAFTTFGLVLYVVKSPIGSNLLRLPIVFGLGFALALDTTHEKRMKAFAAGLTLWIAVVTAIDLTASQSPSSERSFYASLLQHLPADTDIHNRIEVVDPASHGPALYVADKIPLARGWERQLDALQNPLFYGGELNPTTYRQWLDSMAVQWVALPNVPLDYASQGEGRLVNSGLGYLKLTWSDEHWKLYKVEDFTPLAGAPVSSASIKPSYIVLHATATGTANVKVTWTRGMELDAPNGKWMGSVRANGDQNSVLVDFPAAGTYELRVR